jgi:hypothetical protein
LFQLDFQQGSGWEDISSYVDYDSWKGKVSTLWNNLKPVADYCTFRVKPDATLALKFLDYNDAIKVYIKKDGSDYFMGYVRRDAKLKITSKLDAVNIECIDRIYVLQKKIFSSFMWEDYKICDPGDTANSIVHQLLVLAGLTTGDVANVTISTVIDYFVVEENMKEIPGNPKGQIPGERYFKKIFKTVSVGIGGDTYLNILTNLLFQFGYTFYFDESGKLTPYNYLPTDTSTTDYFRYTASTKNILGYLDIEKNNSDIEGVDIRWFSIKELPDPGLEKPILYQDITNPGAMFKCGIELDPAEHYPGGAGTDAVYVDFEIEGTEIVACANVELELVSSGGTVTTNTFTASGRRAKIDIENTHGSETAQIYRLDIIGEAIIKDQDHITKCRLESGTEKVIEYKTEYIRTDADAAKLASGLARHYIYGNLQFRLISTADYDIGGFVIIDEDYLLLIEKTCVILEKKFNEVTGEHTYFCESIANYSLETVSTDRIHRMPKAMLTNNVGYADYLLLLTSTAIIAAYNGDDPASPVNDDFQLKIDEDGVYWQKRASGAWTDLLKLLKAGDITGATATLTGLLTCVGGAFGGGNITGIAAATLTGLLTCVGANLGNGGTTNTGAIAGATTITASGLLTSNGANLSSGGITNAGSIAGVTSLSSTGDVITTGLFDGGKKVNVRIRDTGWKTEDDLFDAFSSLVPTTGDRIIVIGTADVDWNQTGLGEDSSVITEVKRQDSTTIRIFGTYYFDSNLIDLVQETIDCVNGNTDNVMNDVDLRA